MKIEKVTIITSEQRSELTNQYGYELVWGILDRLKPEEKTRANVIKIIYLLNKFDIVMADVVEIVDVFKSLER